MRFLSWTLICCLKFQNFPYSRNCLRSSYSFSSNPTSCQDSAGPSFPATCSQATAWLIGCPELAKALGKVFLVLNLPHRGSLQYPSHWPLFPQYQSTVKHLFCLQSISAVHPACCLHSCSPERPGRETPSCGDLLGLSGIQG